MSTALRFSSSVKVTCTDDSASGWHSGIRSDVFLAAMMPASWATASTSPLAAFLSRISARVAGCMTTLAFAVAMRSVTSLSPTSTMRALPRSSKWVRSLMVLLRQNLAHCRLDVRLAHEALADQERRRTDLGHAREIGRRAEAALGHQHAVLRHLGRKLLGGCEVDRERLEIAVVDADQVAVDRQRALELVAVMHLD